MSEFSKVTTEEGFDIETNARSQESLDRAHAPKEKSAEKASDPAAKAPDKPVGEPNATKPAEEPKNGAAQPPEGKSDEEDEKLDPAARRAKVQERIDRITRERRAEERARQQAERERDELKAKAEANEAELRKIREKYPDAFKQADPEKEPDLADFEDVEEYKKAYREFVIKQSELERETNSKREATMAAKRERMAAFEEKIFTPAKSNPALMEGLPDDLVESVPLSALKETDKATFGSFLLEVLTRVKEPWKVLEFFKTQDGKTEYQRLSTLHPSEVTMEIGMLYKDLSAANQTAPAEKPKPEISKAKPPGKAISSGPPSDSDPYSGDFDDVLNRDLARKRRH